MSGDKTPKGGPSLPEDIAAEAGLPRAEDIKHSLHDIDESVGRASKAAAQNAADTASDLGDRASDAAESVRDRVRSSAADAQDHARDAYDDVRSWASDRYDTQRARVGDFADRGYRRLHEGRTATEDFVSENPLLVGVVGLAAGLLLGALLPRTRQENDALGPYADDLRDQGLRYARDVTRQGRAFVERALDPDNLDAAMEAAEGHGGRQERDYEGAERKAHRL